MKKVIFLLFAVAIASANMYAQGPQQQNAQGVQQKRPMKSPEERAENITKRMTTQLALTADQQAKLKPLILKREQEREQKMKAEKENRDKWDAEVKAILTPEQYQKMQEKRQQQKEKRQEGRQPKQKGNGPPPPPPAPDQQ